MRGVARVYKNYYIKITLYYNKLSKNFNNYSFERKNISVNKYISLKIIDDIDFLNNLRKSSSIIRKYFFYIEDKNSIFVEIIKIRF